MMFVTIMIWFWGFLLARVTHHEHQLYFVALISPAGQSGWHIKIQLCFVANIRSSHAHDQPLHRRAFAPLSQYTNSLSQIEWRSQASISILWKYRLGMDQL